MTFTNNQLIGGFTLAILALLFATKRRKDPVASVDFEPPSTWGPGAGQWAGTGEGAGYGVDRPPPPVEDTSSIKDATNAAADAIEQYTKDHPDSESGNWGRIL